MRVMKRNSTSESQSKAEIALKESEQRYRTTMMSVGDGVIATDKEGKVEMMNPVAEKLTGWKQEKALGKSLEEIFHIINEETRRTVENPVRRVMHEGIVVGLANHTVLIAKDDTEHPIADSGAPIRNEKGDITGVVLVFRDQTKERMVLKSLQESEHKFRETIKFLDEGYYSCLMDGIVLDHNQAFNRILGINISKDMKGSKLPDFWLNPDDRKIYLQELMTSGFITNFQINAKTITGEKVVVMVNSHLVKDEQGKPVRIEGTFTDFTKLKLAEEALKESETKYRTLFENAQVGMYHSRIDGSSMLDVNTKFGEILGLTREESLGKAGRILWADPEDRNKMMKLLKEQGGILYNYEARLLAKNGEVRDVLASIELRPEEGSLDGTFVDITERKRAEEQLRKLNRIYSLLSDINQAIVRTRVPEELFKQICNIAVEQGGFGMAWIGLIDESSQKLRVIAQAGKTNGYHEQVNISLKGKPLSYCPVDSALRKGKHNICKITENEEMAPCQKIAYDLGFCSSASFPLKVFDVLTGVLNLYSDEQDFFDEAELKLMDELAMDISFAIEYSEKEVGRKLVEQSLIVAKDSLEEAQHVARVGSWEWDAVKDEITASGEFFRLFDVTPDQIARFAQFIGRLHPDDRERVQQDVAAALKKDRPYDTDYRVMIHDGGWRDINARGRVITDEEGKPLRMVGTCLDITERKLAEQTLRQSEARYKTLVENIPQKIFMKNSDYRFMSINENFARDLGIRPEEIVGKLDRDLFSIELADKYHADDVRIITTGKTEELEEKYVVDGKETWVNTIKTPVRDNNSEIVGLLGIFWDITGRKLAEEALKISKERLLFATEGANIGIWNWNIVTGELIWSDQCKALFGVPPDETMSYQRFSDALHPDDRERTDKAVKDTLDNQKDFDIEYRSLWPDESIHWLAAKGRGFNDITGKAVRLEGIVLDIAESKRKEEEIRKLNTELEDRVAVRTSQLEASNKELEAFSYSVSHDLRAPLRHVSGYVELLNKHFYSDLPEKGQHYMNSIADSVRIMGMLIDDLLQFSRTGRMEMHQSDCDMNEIVNDVIESLRKDNPDRKIKWIVGKLASINGDEAMLSLVWMNLLSNAVKFTRTRKEARIEIGGREENKELIFFVSDNGVGFDMQYAQKLFGVFQRLHPIEEFEGTGIGLANVNRIVLRQGGRTWAEAEPGKGAVFFFSLPKNKEEI
jgi:PAS domain S-box-containing protein